MSGDLRAVPARWLALPLCLFLAACADDAASRVAAPADADFATQTAFSGNGVLEVKVEKADRSAAEWTVVTIVVSPPAGTSDLDAKQYGPKFWKEVGANGVARFENLPTGLRACVHARSDVALETVDLDHVNSTELYPPPQPATILEPKGDPKQGAVLTGANLKAVPFSPGNYLQHCVNNPPLTLAARGGDTKITLRHTSAASVDVKVLDLVGNERGDVQRGVVTGGFIQGVAAQPIFTCDQIPWLRADDSCTVETPPGFLHSTRGTANPLSVAQGVPFRVEALDRVSVGGNPGVELVATQGFTGGAVTNEILVAENLVCRGGSHPDDHIEQESGNASGMDIQGLLKYSIGVGYGETLSPDPSRVTVWFDMTADDGTATFSTRTVPAGSNQTRSFSMDFSARYVGDEYTCTKTGESGQLVNLGASAQVFCDTASTPPGTVRVTIIQRGIPAWSGHEFNVKTNPDQGSGDSTWDPDRSGASRAFVPVPTYDVCTVSGGNDDRLVVRI